jgi:hypothetical protein
MTDWASFWLHTTREYFPGHIYLCTGGDSPPMLGSDFGDQCRAAAAAHAGVRITNEGSNYPVDFSLTRWVASAGQQYGAYYSFEPAGNVDADGVAVRIYNATTSGALGLHYYFGNLFDSDAARQSFIKYGHYFQQRRPIVEVGVYYPETWIRFQPNNPFLHLLQPLRDDFDFDYYSDDQIADGGLKRVKALILMQGDMAEAGTWQKIADWVKAGGLLLYPDGMGHLRTVEGQDGALQALLAPGANCGTGRVVTWPGDPASADYRAFLRESLASAPELSPLARSVIRADGAEDGVYATLCAPNEVLWLNTTDQDVHKAMPVPVTIPAHGIASVRVTGNNAG